MTSALAIVSQRKYELGRQIKVLSIPFGDYV